MQICVYCAASNHLAEDYFTAARALGAGIAQRGWSLVYGGGGVGLMGAVAEAVRADGGKVIGIIPQALLEREQAFLQADDLIVTTTMRERKQLMDDHADAFVTLPGGFGTLEEVLEIMTLRQLAYHDKPIVLVNVAGYFDPLLSMFERIFEERFAHSRFRDLYSVVESSEAALELLAR
ncbi:MAG TPA: TIGR00730 family Rossman fold protein [Roseiflexaceae bacterium]|nr:TIGR00730 family Rossman fold protein [Roseiflexaceae bacterium]